MEEEEEEEKNVMQLDKSFIETIDEKNNHIMFSYSWNQKNQVRHIYDIIDNEYPDVPKWIDINKMCGNILEAMNDAVENSFLIIIFLSKDYKNSKNCKIESELIIGKQKNFLLVLIDKGYPYLENNETENWLSNAFKNQFYIDLTEMDSNNLDKLKELINTNINKYYEIEDEPYMRLSRRPSFSKKKNSKTNLKKNSPMRNSPVKIPPFTKKRSDSKELNDFILNNNLDQDDIDSIKELVVKTPRTMVPTLKASGVSFKSILNIIQDIKNEETSRDE